MWLKSLLTAVAILILALATLPWWLGLALPVLGRPLHLDFGTYHRAGYSRFVLEGTVYRRGPVRVTVARLEADTPLLWLFHHVCGTDRAILVDGWALNVARGSAPRRSGPKGMVHLHAVLERVNARLNRWVPRVTVTRGTVAWPTGRFQLADAVWRRGVLDFRRLAWKLGKASGRVAFAQDNVIVVAAREPDLGFRTDLRWTGAHVQGAGWAAEQRVALAARYAAAGWLPESAEARAPSWTLPPQAAPFLARYGRLSGSGEAAWRDGAFSVRVKADGRPIAKSVPPLQIEVRAAGDRRSWSVEALRIRSPLGEATLSRPVRFGYPFRPEFSRAELDVSSELSAWPAVALRGALVARFVVSGLPADYRNTPAAAEVAMTAEVKDFAWRGWTLRRASLAADWAKGAVTLKGLDLDGPDGSLQGSGSYEVASRTVAGGVAALRLSPEGLRRLLPKGFAASSASIDVRASGRWPALVHRGDFAVVGARFGSVRPLTVKGDWRGEGERVTLAHAAVTAGSARLTVSGSANRAGAQIAQAAFVPGGAGVWHLEHPATLAWAGGLRIQDLLLTGAGGSRIEVDIGGRPAIQVRLAQVPTDWLREVTTWHGPGCFIQALDFTGNWRGNRLVYTGSFAADLKAGGAAATLSGDVAGDGSGLRVRALRVFQKNVTLATATGRLPLWLNRSGPARVGFDPNGPIEVQAGTGPSSPFWPALAARFGLALEDPSAHLTLKGTSERPTGELSVGVRRLGPQAGRLKFHLPPIENLALVIRAASSRITLDQLAGTIAGQPIQATGERPRPGGGWHEWRNTP
ncbi:MAG: hypothetical protein ACREFX_14525 [Opitutaceae bacterium]